MTLSAILIKLNSNDKIVNKFASLAKFQVRSQYMRRLQQKLTAFTTYFSWAKLKMRKAFFLLPCLLLAGPCQILAVDFALDISCLQEGECIGGFEIRDQLVRDVEECSTFCLDTVGCTDFTFNYANNECLAFYECPTLSTTVCQECSSGNLETCQNCYQDGKATHYSYYGTLHTSTKYTIHCHRQTIINPSVYD